MVSANSLGCYFMNVFDGTNMDINTALGFSDITQPQVSHFVGLSNIQNAVHRFRYGTTIGGRKQTSMKKPTMDSMVLTNRLVHTGNYSLVISQLEETKWLPMLCVDDGATFLDEQNLTWLLVGYISMPGMYIKNQPYVIQSSIFRL